MNTPKENTIDIIGYDENYFLFAADKKTVKEIEKRLRKDENLAYKYTSGIKPSLWASNEWTIRCMEAGMIPRIVENVLKLYDPESNKKYYIPTYVHDKNGNYKKKK